MAPDEAAQALPSDDTPQTEQHHSSGEDVSSAKPTTELDDVSIADEIQQRELEPQESNDQAQLQNREQDTPTPPAPETPSTAAVPSVLCGVCHANPPKYKCPRCRLPYCSVDCNKRHRENHPPDPVPQDKQPEPSINQGPTSLPSSVTTFTTQLDPSNPFSILETSSQLKTLFAKYPNLPKQLLDIHAATQPPPKTREAATAQGKKIPASLMRSLPANYNYDGPKKKEWNHDVGIQNGKAALRKAQRADGVAGEAIREYTELVLHIMSEAGSKSTASSYLQRQLAEQDAKLIHHLMTKEEGK